MKKKPTIHDQVNELQRKFALSVLVRDEILKLAKSAYCQGGDDAHKLLTRK
jgi:hypothetical protein